MNASEPRKTSAGRRGVLIALTLIALSGTSGCRRIRRFFHRHKSVATRATHRTPVARPNAACVGARETAAANHILHASGNVDSIAVASSHGHSLILATVGGAMQAGMLDGSTLSHVGAGVDGDVETGPTVVATRAGFAAAWRRSHGNNEYLVFVRFDPNGTLIGQEHAEQLDSGREGSSMAASDHDFALGYVTAGAIGVQLAHEDGSFSGQPLLLPGSAGSVGINVAWVAPSYLAAWTTETTERSTVTVAQIAPASSEVHPLSALLVHSATSRARLIGANARFVMALYDPSADGTGPNVFTTAFEGSGVRMVDPQPLGEHALATPPSLAFDGEHVAVAWTEEPTAGTTRVRWVKLNERAERLGDPLDVAGSTQSGGSRAAAALSWDGDSYVLARGGPTGDSVAIHRFGPNGCDAR